MKSLNSIYTHSPSVVARKTGDEYILVPVSNNIADMNSVYTLNETGAFIWEHMDGIRTVSDLIDSMVGEYDTDKENAEKDIMEFIEQMEGFLTIR